MGLSPRVRGNPGKRHDAPTLGGSIPACAGEPGSCKYRIMVQAVYPRVCGGTGGYELSDDGNVGLSPRVRGNPAEPAERRGEVRSIPACAGEPSTAP